MSDNPMQMRLTLMVQRGAQIRGKETVSDFAGRRHTWRRQ